MRCQLCVRTTYSTVPKPCEIVLAHTNCASCTKVLMGCVAILSSMSKSADEERNGASGMRHSAVVMQNCAHNIRSSAIRMQSSEDRRHEMIETTCEIVHTIFTVEHTIFAKGQTICAKVLTVDTVVLIAHNIQFGQCSLTPLTPNFGRLYQNY